MLHFSFGLSGLRVDQRFLEKENVSIKLNSVRVDNSIQRSSATNWFKKLFFENFEKAGCFWRWERTEIEKLLFNEWKNHFTIVGLFNSRFKTRFVLSNIPIVLSILLPLSKTVFCWDWSKAHCHVPLRFSQINICDTLYFRYYQTADRLSIVCVGYTNTM